MKIAIWYNLSSGGGAKSLQQHIKGLVARGHQVEVWSPPTTDRKFLDVSNIVKENIIPFDPAVRIREKYFDHWHTLWFRKDTELKKMEAHCQLVANQINTGGFDVLYLQSCQKFYVPLLGKYIKIPMALYLHEPNRTLYEAFPDRLSWIAPAEAISWRSVIDDFFENRKKRIWAREERLNYLTYDVVMANSIFSIEAMQRIYGKGAHWAGTGIETDFFRPLNLDRQNIVLGLGTFYPHKDLEVAIRAIAAIKNNRPTLVWIGNGEDKAYLDGMVVLAEQLEVDFRPQKMIPYNDVLKWLNTAKCLIYTSKLEPLGFAPLEAQACGLPVVGVAEAGIRETVKDNETGFLANRNPQELAKKIELLLTDQELWGKLSANAIKHIDDKWLIDKMLDRLEGFLKLAIENRKN